MKTHGILLRVVGLASGILYAQPMEIARGVLPLEKDLLRPARVFFRENKGQVRDPYDRPRPDILYAGTSGQLHYFFYTSGFSLQLHQPLCYDTLYDRPHHPTILPAEIGTYRIDISFLNANPAAILPESPFPWYENFYTSETPALFVKSYARLRYKEVWPGIDIVFYEGQEGLEYDFFLAPGASAELIRLRFEGATPHIENGDLVLQTPYGEIRQPAPRAWTDEGEVQATWWVKGQEAGFSIQGRTLAQALRIDPGIRIWGTYYGYTPPDAVEYITEARAVALSSSGVFIAGFTNCPSEIATSGAHQTSLIGTQNAFLAKFNPLNGQLVWATYYGSGFTSGSGCAVAPDGSVYLCGATSGTTGIATSGAYQISLAGGGDAFLAKFNDAGIRQWGTYYGGGGSSDGANACAVSQSGVIFIAGHTNSTSGIASSGAHQTTYGGGASDAFLAAFSSSGSRLWATYYGGGDLDYGYSCATDGNGNVFLAGYTRSINNIASNGHQSTLGGAYDAFLVKFSNTGTRLWGTYYGGNGNDEGHACATDDNGNVFLVGSTASSNNIAFSGYLNSYQGNIDAFAVKFSPTGSRVWGTYYGGPYADQVYACAVGTQGALYIAGSTGSPTGIATGGTEQTSCSSLGGCAFLAKLAADGTALSWGTYYGGINVSPPTIGYGCAATSDGYAYLAGRTGYNSASAPNLIGTPGTHKPYASHICVKREVGGQEIIQCNVSAFLAKFCGDQLIGGACAPLVYHESTQPALSTDIRKDRWEASTASGMLSLSAHEPLSLEIWDLSGRLLTIVTLTPDQPTSISLQPGIYFLREKDGIETSRIFILP